MGSESGPFEVAESVEETSSAINSSSGHTLMAAQAGSPQFIPATENTPLEIKPPNSKKEPIKRNFDCAQYNTCLTLSAALNWKSFTCAGCSGRVNQQLVWRARQCIRQDKSLACICKLPQINVSVGKKEEN